MLIRVWEQCDMCQHKEKFVRHAKQAITVNFTGIRPHAEVNASMVRCELRKEVALLNSPRHATWSWERTLRSPTDTTTESLKKMFPNSHVVEMVNAPTLSLREALHHRHSELHFAPPPTHRDAKRPIGTSNFPRTLQNTSAKQLVVGLNNRNGWDNE